MDVGENDEVLQKKLIFPAVCEGKRKLWATFTLRPPTRIAPWPWRATMLTAFHCYGLWVIFWLQFVTHVVFGSFLGNNLGYYVARVEPLGLSAPEIFLAFSVLYSVFAVVAVVGGTWRTPRLWKRLLAVLLFAFFAIGGAVVVLKLRENSYRIAKENYERLLTRYENDLADYYDDESHWDSLWRRVRLLNWHGENLRLYEERYHPEIKYSRFSRMQSLYGREWDEMMEF